MLFTSSSILIAIFKIEKDEYYLRIHILKPIYIKMSSTTKVTNTQKRQTIYTVSTRINDHTVFSKIHQLSTI